MVADNALQANLIWNSVFCADQLSSKLISHPPLTWLPPKLTCNVNTEAQISQKIDLKLQDRSWAILGAIFGRSWGGLGAILGDLGRS